jgi:hypothetical protein
MLLVVRRECTHTHLYMHMCVYVHMAFINPVRNVYVRTYACMYMLHTHARTKTSTFIRITFVVPSAKGPNLHNFNKTQLNCNLTFLQFSYFEVE